MLFNQGNDAITFMEDFGSMILEVKIKAAENPTTDEGLRILTPKQLLKDY